MNKRIQELAEQATKGEWKLNRYMCEPVFEKGDLDTEKFAELIVRECIDVLVDVLPDIVPEAKDGIHPIWHIKEHFGVEE